MASGEPGAPAVEPSAGPARPATPPAPLPPGRLVLIGTGHVFDIEATVRGAIQALQPDVVFVELDRGRLEALVQRRRGVTGQPKPKAFVHRRLQEFQEGIAGMYGAEVGSEMLGAVAGAQDVGAKVMLVDVPAETTLKRALAELTFGEKLRAGGLAAKGVAQAAWQGLTKPLRRATGRDKRAGDKAAIDAEIRKYQEDPEAALRELAKAFPTVHRIVIDERDETMARRIRKGLAGARLGIAVVGDGHVGGMLRRLADLSPTVYRLDDVREGRLPSPTPVARGDPSTVRFGFDTQA